MAHGIPNRWIKAGAVALVLAALAVIVRLRFGALLEPKVAAQMLSDVRGSPWALPGFLLAYVTLTTAFAPAFAGWRRGWARRGCAPPCWCAFCPCRRWR